MRNNKARRTLFARLSRRRLCSVGMEDSRNFVNVRTYFAFGFEVPRIDRQNLLDFLFVPQQHFLKVQSLRPKKRAGWPLVIERTWLRIWNFDEN
jgi:hypothetical protein